MYAQRISKRSLRPEQYTELARDVASTVSATRTVMRADPDTFLSDLLTRLVNMLQGGVRDIARRITVHPTFRASLLEIAPEVFDSVDVSRASKEVAIRFLHHECDTRIKIGNVVSLNTLQINLLRNAYLDRDAIEYELKGLQQTICDEANAVAISKLSLRIEELEEVLAVVDTLTPQSRVLVDMCRALFKMRDGRGGSSLLLGFLRDAAMLHVLDAVLSKRIVRRLLQRVHFSRSGGELDSVRFRNGFLKTLSEFTQLCFGCVEPELFTPARSRVITSGTVRTLETLCRSDFSTPLEVVAYTYQTSVAGTFFWNQWAIVGQRPTRTMSAQVRRFVTKLVRSRERFVFALPCVQTFMETVRENGNEDGVVARAFLEVLQAESFNVAFMSHLGKDWGKYVQQLSKGTLPESTKRSLKKFA